MKPIQVFIGLCFIILLSTSAWADLSGSITLDNVEGTASGSAIGLGTVTFNFRVTIDPTSASLKGFTNGMRIYSPDGATWDTPVGTISPDLASYFDLYNSVNHFGADGIGEDTLAFIGLVRLSDGLPTGWSDIGFSITTGVQAEDEGKTICIDSTFYPPTGYWKWSTTGFDAQPAWDGPHCFYISSCVGTTPDSDGDGLGDACDPCPTDPTNDADADGICGNDDNCPNTYNPNQDDFDGDLIGDECDVCTDTDNDGYGNPGFAANTCPDDNCPDTYNPDQNDADGDGIGDVCDECTDTDGDGYGNPGYPANTCPTDNCPDTYNPDQTDIDGDGIGQECDECIDSDGDGYGDPGYPSNTCPEDNCPDVYNPDQNDADEDGIGDICDECTDTDGDGYGDPGFAANTCPEDNCPNTYNPDQTDTDGDGKGDACDAGEVYVNADVQCGLPPLTVNFTFQSTSSTTFTSFHWYFGDGGESFEENPTYIYTTSGVFDVSLVISDGVVTDSLVFEQFITTLDGIDVDFTASTYFGTAPLPVLFDSDINGPYNSLLWDFGDGHFSNLANPIHTFATTGRYEVKLVVSYDQEGCAFADSVTKNIHVRTFDFVADFEADVVGGVAPLTVNFTNTSLSSPEGTLWTFGDGGTSNEYSPTHTYTTPGVYDVQLIAFHISTYAPVIEADTVIKHGYIKVSSEPIVDLTGNISTTPISSGQPATFYYGFVNRGTSPGLGCSLKIVPPPEFTVNNVDTVGMQTGTFTGFTTIGDTIIVPLGSVEPSDWYGGRIALSGTMGTLTTADTIRSSLVVYTTSADTAKYDNVINYQYIFENPTNRLNKYAYPGGLAEFYDIEPYQRINYLLTFKNDPLVDDNIYYIRAVDTLSEYLDYGTLTIDYMSHPGVTAFDFNSVSGLLTIEATALMLLPDETFSFGFSINPKSDLTVGTMIPNRDWVRMDFMPWEKAPVDFDAVVRTTGDWPCCKGTRGNIDGDPFEVVDIVDLVYLIEYSLKEPNGPPPPCLREADVNGDDILEVTDIVYLIDYMLRRPSGPAPFDCYFFR